MYQDEMISKADYLDDLASLEAQIKNLASAPIDWFSEAKKLFDLAVSLQTSFSEKGSKKAKKEALAQLRSNLVWDDQKLSIINTKLINTYIYGLKRAKAKIPSFEPKNYVVDKGRNTDFSALCPSLRRWVDDVRNQLKQSGQEN